MKWTESIAVGNMEIAGEAKSKLGARAIDRKILETEDTEIMNSARPSLLATLFLPLKGAAQALKTADFEMFFLKNQLDNLVRQD